MTAHAAILQVIVPLLAAPLCLFLRQSARLCWLWSTIVTGCTLIISIYLFFKLQINGNIIYEIGGWASPWGIEYRVDLLSAVLLLIISGISFITLLYMPRSINNEISKERHYLFYLTYMLCTAGLLGIAITGDAFNLFVFLEISSLSSYVLISFGKDRRATTAAFRYLIMGTLGATFYIIGVGLLYMMTGTLNIADLATLIPAISDTRPVIVALAFLTVGLCLKIALFPLHFWLPNSYTYAPLVVTIFLASTATKVAIYALIRVYFTMFGAYENSYVSDIQYIWFVLALSGIFIGSLVAIFQTNIKRMLAYSSVAQIGYIILGLSFLSSWGMAAGIVHLFNHSIMKAVLFMAVGNMLLQRKNATLESIAGIAKTMPWTMAAFVGGALSLIGVPGTVGFISKWYLVKSAIDGGYWIIAICILFSSILSIIYLWRVIEAAYFKVQQPLTPLTSTEAPISMLAPTWILLIFCVYFGLDGTKTMDVALSIANILVRGQL